MTIDLNGDLKFDHNRNSITNSNRTEAREIGNRLLALRLIDLTIQLTGKLALLAAVIWTVSTISKHIEIAAATSAATATQATNCGPATGRGRMERLSTP